MKTTICLFVAIAIVTVQGMGYGRRQKMSSNGYGSQQSSGYGLQQQSSGYGSQQSSGYGNQQSGGYDDQSAEIDYNLKYEIYLPEDNHGSSAQWMVEQDKQNVHYTLDQTHPYGAKSNVYYSMQNDH